MAIKVHKAGLQTTVQDSGRSGYRKYGVANNGALDEYSHRLANWLVGKEKDSPTLEVTQIGPVLEFTTATTIGIAGAEFELFINDQAVPINQTLHIKAGDTLSFGHLKSGARAYIAFSGDLEIPSIMQSRSTNLLASFGGLNGRALQDGDCLSISSELFAQERTVPEELLMEHHHNLKQKHIIVRMIPGREFSCLEKGSKEKFLCSDFEVNSYSNRMAIKLDGAELSTREEQSMITSPIVPGTVQLPSNGQPIIILADGQTAGGYPRIGQVITADLSLLAQLKPHDRLSFYPIDIQQAKKILLQKQDFISNLIK
ncbi:5-oxoprolinase subunit C family protein [Kangiella sediminilitoris]|uniref:Urea amidolyase related protein n=1 Tax=Kangiella sediminilitoris TaxID=1144748 RepID=A0A1B3BCW1_9GAMM|nr:biotin-dependent carboxyltransferase family protein [Kangiella sediminilitoris]AOE50588.1 Urea amidolyase related protein [Kangiella sediminilitoris]